MINRGETFFDVPKAKSNVKIFEDNSIMINVIYLITFFYLQYVFSLVSVS